jgi:hypothetical protein
MFEIKHAINIRKHIGNNKSMIKTINNDSFLNFSHNLSKNNKKDISKHMEDKKKTDHHYNNHYI